jgi:hypothetical protein
MSGQRASLLASFEYVVCVCSLEEVNAACEDGVKEHSRQQVAVASSRRLMVAKPPSHDGGYTRGARSGGDNEERRMAPSMRSQVTMPTAMRAAMVRQANRAGPSRFVGWNSDEA